MAPDAIGAHHPPKPAYQHPNLVARTSRKLVGPEDLGEHVDRNGRATRNGQRGQQSASLTAADLVGSATLYQEPPEEPDAQVVHDLRLRQVVDDPG